MMKSPAQFEMMAGYLSERCRGRNCAAIEPLGDAPVREAAKQREQLHGALSRDIVKVDPRSLRAI